MKIVLCAYGRAGKECFIQLLKEGYEVQSFLIFTHDDKLNTDFIEFLKNLKAIFFFNSINRSIDNLKEFNGKVLLSVYYKFIVRSNILDLFNGKSMNCHPSLLPDYKGCFSSVWALLNKETETGISFHYMLPGVDEGNIILQRGLKILGNDTAYSLYNKLISLFVENFNNAFTLLLNGHDGVNQKEIASKGRYYNRSLPLDGILEIKNANNEDIEQFIKAMYFPPYPVAKFTLDGKEISNKDIQVENKKCLEFLEL